MNTYKITFKTWDAIVLDYERQFMDLSLYNDSYDLFLKVIDNPKASILELGCGPGMITRYMMQRFPKLNYTATDVSSQMINRAESNVPQVKFKVLDCRNLSSIKQQFDGVICGFTLPYLSKEDRLKLVSDCAGLLSDKGILYLSYVAGDQTEPVCMTDKEGNSLYFYYHQTKELKKEIEMHEFQLIEIINLVYKKKEGVEEGHTVIIARKNRISDLIV